MMRGSVAALAFACSSPAATRYVWPNSPNPKSPYTNWTTAGHAIQTVIDAAVTVNGDTILVTNGVYATGGKVVVQTTNRVAVTKAITVRSVNGPSVTIIRGAFHPVTTNGNAAVRCAFVTNGAVLAGFTLTNGATRDFIDAYGGGVACATNNAVVSNCVIVGNGSVYGGGAYKGTLFDCTIANNTADYGGGTYESVLDRCALTGNWAGGGEGGGAYSGTLGNCTLSGNSASWVGGGAAYATLTSCVLSNNSASYSGGGMDSSTATNCIVTRNSARYGGGANKSFLVNGTLSRNSAVFGGGAYVNAAGGDQGGLFSCTVVGNSASLEGGGANGAWMQNCICYYNTAPCGPNGYGRMSYYSCATPNTTYGGHSIADPPQIAGIDNPHLLAGSPCIDAGTNSDLADGDTDGESRIAGGTVDMGCDEFHGPPAGPLSVHIDVPWTNLATSFAAPFEAVVQGKPSQLVWNWGDGASDTNLCLATHVFAAAGTYPVALTATNASDHASATVTVQVVSQPVHYVAPGGGHVSPFTDWLGAATNIQSAIAAGNVAGRLVLVSNGVYQTGGALAAGAITNRVVLTNAVTVRSVGGPAVTTLRGAGPTGSNAVRCAYVAANCLLSGFTLTNGFTQSAGDDLRDNSGGGAWCEAGGMLSNCVIAGNTAYAYGGGAFGAGVSDSVFTGNSAHAGGGANGGELRRCTLRGNFTNPSGGGTVIPCGGGAYNAWMEDCTIASNAADYGGGVYDGVMVDCTMSSNSATLGGGAFGGWLLNCVLTRNFAQRGGGVNRGHQLNCTIVGNSAGQGGGGYDSVRFNCIIYYNTLTNVEAGSTTAFCCVTPLPGGWGNITNAPMFVNTNGWSDLHLAPGSPCINAGSNLYVAAAADFDGLPRVIGGTVDMGVYESANGVTSNGVPWGWLLQYGWATDGSDDLDDPEGDGFPVWMRYVAGTDPTSATSRFRITAVSNAPQARVCFLPDLVDRVYTLEYTEDFSTGAWTAVPGQSQVPGTGPGQWLSDTNGTAPARFYRAKVALP